MKKIVTAGIVAALLPCAAQAADVFYAVDSIKTTDRAQLGRPSRNGMPSMWATKEAYPGILPTTASTTYYYKSYDIDFAANAFQDIYYEISVFDETNSGLFFTSAYKNSASALTRAANFIGDIGSSGNIQFYSGDPGNARTFQVIVPAGQKLVLDLNTTGGGTSGTGRLYDLAVSAFSDTEYSEDFLTAPPPAAVPEPGVWAMLTLGFGAIGYAMRRKNKGETRIRFA